MHISHSYLLHQFLSPLYNKRTDEYGGSFENRLRFGREVIAAVRSRVGTDWVVGVRISLSDFIPGALDVEDAIRVAQTLEADGHLDYVNVTAAGYHNIFLAIQPSDEPDGYLVDLTAQVKAAVSELPVFTVGGIKDPALAEEILASGKADMVAMTRAQIADPEFANKVQEGREDEVVHCIRGNQGCIGRVFKGLPISCTVNPAAGREGRLRPLVAAERAGALGRRGRRPGGDEGRRHAGPARPLGHAARARRCARRAGQPDPADARARRVRLDHARPRGAAAEGRRRGAARDRGDRGRRGASSRRTACSSPPARRPAARASRA